MTLKKRKTGAAGKAAKRSKTIAPKKRKTSAVGKAAKRSKAIAPKKRKTGVAGKAAKRSKAITPNSPKKSAKSVGRAAASKKTPGGRNPLTRAKRGRKAQKPQLTANRKKSAGQKPSVKQGAQKRKAGAAPSKQSVNKKSLSSRVSASRKKGAGRRVSAPATRTGRPNIPIPAGVRLHYLPFLNMGWTGEQFQDVCANLLSLMPGHSDVEQRGVKGELQGGVDLRDTYRDETDLTVSQMAYECKLESTFGAQKVQGVADRAEEQGLVADRKVILLGRDASAQTQDRAMDCGWEIWDARRLSNEVRLLAPWKAQQFVHTWFGPETVAGFLNITHERVFVTGAVYFQPQTDVRNLANHERPLINREAEMDQLRAFRRGGQKVMLLAAPRFMGKSRLLRELAYDSGIEDELVFRQSDAEINETALNELLSVPTTIVIDKYDDVAELNTLIRYAAGHANIKLIIAVEPHQEAVLRSAMVARGIAPADVAPTVRLNSLSDQETRELILATAPALRPIAAASLAAGTSENPLSAIAAATIASAPADERVAVLENVNATILALNHDLLQGTVHPNVPPALAVAILRFIASRRPSRISEEHLQFIAGEANVERDQVEIALHRLVNANIIVHDTDENRYEVRPDFVAIALIRDAALVGDHTTRYLERSIDAFGFEHDLLVMTAVAGYTLPEASRPLRLIWHRYREAVRAGSYWDRIELLKRAIGVGLFEPDLVIDLVHLALEAAPGPDAPELLRYVRPATREDLEEVIPALLRDILRAHPQHFRAVFELLWPLVQRDQRQPSSTPDHPLRVLREAVDYAYVPVEAIELIAQDIADLLESARPGEARSPLEILEPVLKRGEHIVYGVHRGVAIVPTMLDSPQIRQARSRVIDLFLQAASSSDEQRALHAIRALKIVVGFAENVGVPVTEEQLAAWNAERERALDGLAGIIGRFGAIRDLQIAEILRWYLGIPPISTKAAQVVGALVNDASHRLMRTIVPEFRQQFPYSKKASSAYQAHVQDLERLCEDAVDDLLADGANAQRVLEQLKTAAHAAVRAGLSADIQLIMSEITRRDSALGIQILELAVAQRAQELLPGLFPALRAAWESDYRRGFDLSQQLLDLDNPFAEYTVVNGVNHSIDPVPPNFDAAMRLQVMIRLLRSPNAQVRNFAAMGLSTAVEQNPATAARVILENPDIPVDTLDYAFVAVARDADSLAQLDENAVEALAQRLQSVPRLDYWMCRFLALTAQRDPRLAIDTLIARVERPWEAAFHAVPYEGLHGIAEALKEAGGLRLAMDATIMRTTQSTLEDERHLFRHLAKVDEDEAVAALGHAAAQAQDEAAIRQVARFTRSVDAEKLLADGALLGQIVDRGYALSYEIGERVGTELLRAFDGRERMGTAGEPFPLDVLLRDRGAALKNAARAGSQQRRYFEALEDLGRQRAREDND